MKALINYGILLAVGGVFTTSTSPLPLPESLPNLSTAISSAAPASPSKMLAPNGSIRSYRAWSLPSQSGRPSSHSMWPDMIVIPPCDLIDRFENGRVYDTYGRPVGSPPSTVSVASGTGGLTYVNSIEPSAAAKALAVKPPAAK
jgi:hypothetical protein